MQLPTLPTDNLYKFLALSGIALFVLSVVITNQSANDALRESDKLRIELAGLQADVQALGEDTAYAKTHSDVQHERERLLQLRRQAMIGRAESATLDRLIAVAAAYRSLGNWLGSVGGGLTLLGFVLWYVKLQRHQDEIVRREATAK